MRTRDTTYSTAAQVRNQVLRSGERLWAVEDFDGPASAVSNELRRLVARGELRRVRRGVYWRGTRSRFGMSAPQPGDALRAIIGPDEAIGATGWHATNLLGLSTQVAPLEAVAVTRRTPTGLVRVQVVSRAARSGRRKAKLTGLEVTFLEVLDGWEHYVEADAVTALDRLCELLTRSDIRVTRLVQASVTEPAAVRERLRAVLRHAGYERQADRVQPARDPRTRARALNVLGTAA